MRSEPDSTFNRIIEEHLELRRRNAELEPSMPLDRYRVADPFENHPLFKTEEQARLEDTLSGSEPAFDADMVLAWPAEEERDEEEAKPDLEDTLWGRSRDFDWGD